jgi:lipopolysaccharide transport system permease protein
MTEQTGDLALRIITPESGLHALRLSAGKLITEFPAAFHLASRLFVRDTSAEHRQSLLGYTWLVAPVLGNTVVWVFLNSQNVISINSGSVPYALFVLSGVVLWTAFNGAVMAMLGVVSTARGVLSKVSFPHEALVYSGMLRSLLDAALAALVLIPAMFFLGATWSRANFLYPVALLACLVLGWSLGLLFVPIAALYGDISRAIQLALRFGFFLTPVVFPVPSSGVARQFMQVNPVTPLIASGRSWLTGSPEVMPAGFALCTAGAVILFCVGLVLYKVALPYVIERVAG